MSSRFRNGADVMNSIASSAETSQSRYQHRQILRSFDLVCPYFAGTGESTVGHRTRDEVSPVMSRREGSPFSTCWQCFSLCSPDGLLCCNGTLLLHVQTFVHQHPQVFFCMLLCSWWAPSLYGCMGLFLPRLFLPRSLG